MNTNDLRPTPTEPIGSVDLDPETITNTSITIEP